MEAKTMRGAVGIGTLIIFIAMVLVAAIAAAVLINVSGILQQRAMTTGKEAIAQVSSNLIVLSVTGITNQNKTNIDNLTITLSAAAGAGRLDLGKVVLKVGNGDNLTVQKYTSTSGALTANGANFTAIALRDPSNLFTQETPVIDSGSLIQLTVVPSNASAYETFSCDPTVNPGVQCIVLPPRSPLHIELIPEHGAAVVIDVVTPPTYSTTQQHLYP
ncbi:MAG: archaellin/type IV pilin N-terminal domain-containing protein [Candidatus Micrarchaeia archaeon]